MDLFSLFLFTRENNEIKCPTKIYDFTVDLILIDSYAITNVHVINIAANNKLTQLGTNWFRKKWIKNKSTCLWHQSVSNRTNIDFYMPVALNI